MREDVLQSFGAGLLHPTFLYYIIAVGGEILRGIFGEFGKFLSSS